MSNNNNIYNILNNFNKVVSETTKPAEVKQPAAKTKLHESMDAVLSKKFENFAEGKKAKPDFLDVDKDKNKKETFKKALADKEVKEVAPPGKKAERMVKHVKAGYAKDGKVTDKEKSIAYATAWKAKNAGKVEEAIQSLLAAGFTKEQIVEGWDDMIKDVEKKRKEEKGTGKFDKKKISTGTVHTRKYDSKSGESEDDGKDGEGNAKEKRGRGRPKKSAFEGTSKIDQMVASLFESAHSQDYVSMQNQKPFEPSQVQGKKPGLLKRVGSAVATGAKKVARALAHPSDEELLKDLQKKSTMENAELVQMIKIAGLKGSVSECMSPVAMGAGSMEQSQGKMNVSTNMSSDGNKSVTITADGDSALELMQMLKLAGMGGAEQARPEVAVAVGEPEEIGDTGSAGPAGVMVPTTDGDEGAEETGEEETGEEEVEEDERFQASTTPDEHVSPIQSQTKGGDGEVAGQEKKMHGDKPTWKNGDNPMAESVALSLMKEYNSIKIQK